MTKTIPFSVLRGVFQTLVEKHFPAPDRRKAFDMLGLSNYAQRDNAESLDGAGYKRKRGQFCVLVIQYIFCTTTIIFW